MLSGNDSTNPESPVLAIKDLHTYFFTRQGVVRAVNGVSLDIRPCEFLGLVGETGSGKSMTAASILQLVRSPGRIVQGEVWFQGRDLAQLPPSALQQIRGRSISLIIQNAKASLNPLVTVGQHILNVYRAHLPLAKAERQRHMLSVLRACGFEHPERIARSYPHQLSGGMAQRIVIASAIGTSPDLVIADEPTTGLDVTVQAQVLDMMTRLIEEAHAAALLITHDLRIVANYCDRVAVMYEGRIVEYADVKSFFAGPIHPYSVRLLESLKFPATPIPPDKAAAPTSASAGHRYSTESRGVNEVPQGLQLREVRPGHWVECDGTGKVVDKS